jgi:hypothetical protein
MVLWVWCGLVLSRRVEVEDGELAVFDGKEGEYEEGWHGGRSLLGMGRGWEIVCAVALLSERARRKCHFLCLSG